MRQKAGVEGEVMKASVTSVTEGGRADRIWGPSQRRQKEEVEGRPRDGAGSGAGYGDGETGA